MLYSLPDNDAYSHRNGPHAQVTSLAAADRQIERLMHAAGGPDEFLEQYAVIVCSDHSQAPVEERIRLDLAFEDFDVATAQRRALDRRRARAQPRPALGDDLRAGPRPGAGHCAPARVEVVAELEGVDLVMWRARTARRSSAAAAASCASPPAASCPTPAARRWSVEGDLGVLRAEIQDGRFLCHRVSGRAGAGRGRRCTAPTPGTSCCRPRRAMSSWTGADRTTWAAGRTAPCTARTRSGRCCGAAPGRTPGPRATSGRCATSPRWSGHISV